MKKLLLTLFAACLFIATYSQIVSLNPSNVGPDDPVILTFDATEGNGELAGANKVYMHHGIVVSGPDGTEWNYVIGNWGADDGVGEMAPVPGEPDKWQIEMNPSIRDYFGAPQGENIFRISAVFRSADGNTKGTTAPGSYGWGEVTSNLDFFIDLNAGSFVSITQPIESFSILQPAESYPIEAYASSEVTDMSIWIDEGSGFVEKANVSSGTTVLYQYTPLNTGVITIKITATINGDDVEFIRSHNNVILQPSVVEAVPPGMVPGINYHEGDDTKVTLVLEAPGKEFGHVVGDFTNWNVLDEYQMKLSPDGEMLWLEIDGLTPMEQYVFQYWVNLEAKVGDPYAELVVDPWNDQYIDESVYPDIPEYGLTEHRYATVLQTGQEDYNWDASEDNWERPDLDHLVIYELLVRDFLGSHSYDDLIDTLSYIKNLGVEAIELMPFNEFGGNESWGYNPLYYFAPDKYYGTEDDLKRFIETCHQMGLAVIMDIVLNHAERPNPMVLLYYDWDNNKPAADNPWFNANHVGPFEWGNDFNHESDYTKAFVDRVNKFWLEEYHIDGFRFDFTKGFTNYAPGGSIDGYDQSRIDILKRMADKIWEADPEAYVILEHWGPYAEEQELANYGMKLWRNRSYDYVPAAVGNNSGNFQDMGVTTHVSYFDSHDERRIAEHMISEGAANGGYAIKDPLIMYERAKMSAAFAFLFPGPKMIWQFDELGYDIHIDFNGRTGNKPLPWGQDGLGYYEDPLRQYIYDAYKGILDVRNQIGPEELSMASTDHQLTGATRRLAYDMNETDLVVIGNFATDDQSVDPKFTQTGTWYDYFSGDSIDVVNVTQPIDLKAGQWHIYTTERLSDGLPGVVEIYDNPVTIEPYPFTKNTEITITFDATRAFPDGTAGLVGADKVYFHSGVVLTDPDSTTLENVVGTFMDDGIGEMTEISEDIWQIVITPRDYYSLSEDDETFKIGMYFRDANNENVGKGFRNSTIFFNVESDRPFVTIEPEAFLIGDEITVTFNARRGNQELVGTDKVYMHSGAGLISTSSPWNSAWNNVVGNWGADDGIGEMSEVAGEEDIWEITFVPEDYYGLDQGDHMYWLAAVFRNADGSVKGTGTPGLLPNGLIHTNQDFFIANQLIISTEDIESQNQRFIIYPNPAQDFVNLRLDGFTNEVQLELFDINGQKISGITLNGGPAISHNLEVGNLPSGIYIIRATDGKNVISKELIKF